MNMDPRMMAPAACSLLFLTANIARAIKNVVEQYEAAPTTARIISRECLSIDDTLVEIEFLIKQPHGLSPRAICQHEIEEALQNAGTSCSFTITRLEEEIRDSVGDEAASIKRLPPWTVARCDEMRIQGLLHQIQRQLSDIKSLIIATQRDFAMEIRQILMSDTFIGDLIDVRDATDIPSTPAVSTVSCSQTLYGDFDMESSSMYSPATTRAYSFTSRAKESISLLDRDSDTATIISRSPSSRSCSEKNKKAPRAQMGTILFKLFKSNTELHRAAKKGDARKIRELHKLGVDINYEGSSGCTALHLATDCGHEAAVRALLDLGADPMIKSSEGRVPLHTASRAGFTTIVKLLLEKGADIRAKDPCGSAALHIAAYNGQESVVEVLLIKHPVVEMRGPSGFTALHVAAFNGQSAVVRLLIEMGADLEARSDTGRTAIQLAAEKGHEAVVKHLLHHGANVMAKDNIGRTALQGAVSNQHGVVAQLLLDKVVPEIPTHWQDSGRSESVTSPVVELDSDDSAFSVAGSVSRQSSTRFHEVSSTPIYELADTSAVGVELPGDEMFCGIRRQKVTSHRRTVIDQQRRGGVSAWSWGSGITSI